MGRLVDRRRITRLRDGVATEVVDQLAVEEPLTIRVNSVDTATTMRTPGHDIELALGWLVSEGTVHTPDDVVGAIACDENTVEVRLTSRLVPPTPRLTMTSSACGICGADSITEVVTRRGTVLDDAAEDCTQRACSPSTVIRSASAKTSDATTRSTRSLAGRCSTRRFRHRSGCFR
jgi:formate dehydrogenase accessory protein FdhD